MLQEFDSPHILLKNSDSLFSSLVGQTGPITSSHLRHLASAAYKRRELKG